MDGTDRYSGRRAQNYYKIKLGTGGTGQRLAVA